MEGDFGTALPLIIFGGLSVIAGVLSLFLPETKGKILPETIEDAEQFGKYVFCGLSNRGENAPAIKTFLNLLL